MKSIDLYSNGDGTWTAKAYGFTFTGTHDECLEWLWEAFEAIVSSILPGRASVN